MHKKVRTYKNDGLLRSVETSISHIEDRVVETGTSDIPKIKNKALKKVDCGFDNLLPAKERKSVKTIGLILADISNPFSSVIARIIEEEASNAGYAVILGNANEDYRKAGQLIDIFIEKQVDGFIISPPAGSEEGIVSLERRGVPFVLLDRYFPAIATNYVALDNFQAAYMATNHLIDHGHKRIGMIGFDTKLHHLNERRRGYVEALMAHHREFDQRLVVDLQSNFQHDDIEAAMDQLTGMEDPVDAIFVATNKLGMHALRYVNFKKIKVPEELAIVSFDETEFLDLFITPVTQVRQPLKEMGKAATEILIEAIRDNNRITQLNLQPLLAIRGSSTMTRLERTQPESVKVPPLSEIIPIVVMKPKTRAKRVRKKSKVA